MLTLLSRGCSVLVHGISLRWLALLTLCLLPATVRADSVGSQEIRREGRDAVRAWTLHRIAVIQAAHGDVTDAKNTVAEIDEPDRVRGAGDATGVCLCNGQLVELSLPSGWSQADLLASQVFLKGHRAQNRVPSSPPRGLPANYFAADPRHGAIVNFVDERDSYGTRVVTRRYADGYTVIETPHVDKGGR